MDAKDIAPMPTHEDLISALFGVADQSDDLRREGKVKEAQQLDELLVAATVNLLEHPSRITEAGEFPYEGPCACHECQQYGAS